MRVYVYENIPMVHISSFAAATHHDVSTCRNMLTRLGGAAEGGGSKRRPIKYFRDGSTVWIPVTEITGYPFIKGTNCYHYTENGEKYLCETCTFTNEMCEAAKKADELVVPVGDP